MNTDDQQKKIPQIHWQLRKQRSKKIFPLNDQQGKQAPTEDAQNLIIVPIFQLSPQDTARPKPKATNPTENNPQNEGQLHCPTPKTTSCLAGCRLKEGTLKYN